MEAIPGQSVQQWRLFNPTAAAIAASLPTAAATVISRGRVGGVKPSEAPGPAETGASQPEEAREPSPASGGAAGWPGRALPDQARGRGLGGAYRGLHRDRGDDHPDDKQHVQEAPGKRRGGARPDHQAQQRQGRAGGGTREATQTQTGDGQGRQPAQGKRSRDQGEGSGQRRRGDQGILN